LQTEVQSVPNWWGKKLIQTHLPPSSKNMTAAAKKKRENKEERRGRRWETRGVR
jgi:hypothetical protein